MRQKVTLVYHDGRQEIIESPTIQGGICGIGYVVYLDEALNERLIISPSSHLYIKIEMME